MIIDFDTVEFYSIHYHFCWMHYSYSIGFDSCTCPCLCNIMTKGDLTQSFSPSFCSVQVCKLQLKQNSTLCVSAPVWGYQAMLYVGLINVSLQWGVAPLSCVSRFLLLIWNLLKALNTTDKASWRVWLYSLTTHLFFPFLLCCPFIIIPALNGK